MAQQDPKLLNNVYREISERLGMDIALEIYQMFRGQQIHFPVRFLNSEELHQRILQEYDGSNVRSLAIRYHYSEKTVRRILRNTKEKER